MRRDEKGFSIISLAVAVAISAIIATGVGMTTVQILDVSRQSSDWATAVRQAQNVGYWVSQDALMAQTINATDDLGTTGEEFIIIAWKDWENGDVHDIRYFWLDSADALKKLKRQQITRDKEGVTTGNITTLVADNIYTADLSSQDDAWRLNVEARSGEKSLTREYEISRRINSY